MERKESIVIQVAPNYENEKIREMEKFGWELQNRQEIHESGVAFATRTSGDGNYVINQLVSKYVKLHFARSLSFPNLDKIKLIESEYFNLSFPSAPSLIWPYIFTLFWVPGIIIGLVFMAIPWSVTRVLGIVMIIVNGLLVLAGRSWIHKRRNAQKAADRVCEQSTRRAKELIAQVESITASEIS